MDKRLRHNLLLILAVIVLLIGVIIQLYLMVTSDQNAEGQNTTEIIAPPK